MPVPVLALDEALLVELELVVVDVVLPVVLEPDVVVLDEPPALLVEAPPAPLVAPVPSATLPPEPSKPPTPSLSPPVSAALAQPCAALPNPSATSTKLKPIVFTHASDAGIVAYFGNNRDCSELLW
jgi:hypothetical protein